MIEPADRVTHRGGLSLHGRNRLVSRHGVCLGIVRLILRTRGRVGVCGRGIGLAGGSNSGTPSWKQ